jgi:hypothetical protein
MDEGTVWVGLSVIVWGIVLIGALFLAMRHKESR